MKKHSRIIVIILWIIALILVGVMFLQNKNAGISLICFIISFFLFAFLGYFCILKIGDRVPAIKKKRQEQLNGNSLVKILPMVLPTFLLIFAAQKSIYLDSGTNLIMGISLGFIYGIASYFSTEKFL